MLAKHRFESYLSLFIVMSNVQVSVRISPYLYEKLVAHANANGIPKSKVIAYALDQYLDPNSPESVSLEGRMDTLEKRLRQLESRPDEEPSLSDQEIFAHSSLEISPPPPAQELTFEGVQVDHTGEIIERISYQAKYFQEDLGEGIGLEMIYIPEGTLMMGSTETEQGTQASERPQHLVTLQSFFLAKFPITQVQWQRVAHYPKVKRDLQLDPSFFKGSDRPVEQISWEDAVEFCDRLSQHTQRPYQLPSEAQWEYACRGGTTTPFYFGPTLTGDLANYIAKRTYIAEGLGIYRQQTTPVGQFFPNAFGLYDLHGNVWEWCADAWHSNYIGAPISGEAWLSPNVEAYRVLRGGSWDYDADQCRCAYRYAYHPKAVKVKQFGFRAMCNLPQW